MNAFTCLLATLAAGTTLSRGQTTFSIDWFTIDGGGGGAPGSGEFAITGSSIGPVAAGDPGGAPQGEFSLTGGYWTFALDSPLDLNFRLQLNGGLINLWWDAGGPPVVLERSNDLRLWQVVGPQPAVPPYQDPAGPRRYYRLTRIPD